MRKEIDVSIIIVHYKAEHELFNCISSLVSSIEKVSYEVIIVDNDEIQKIDRELRRKFPSVKYIKNRINSGYGGGNNLGASVARGKYLFFLNPDTIILPITVDYLFLFINTRRKVAAVSPLLLKEDKSPYPLQGSKELNFLTALFGNTFIHSAFPWNPVSQKFWLKRWNKKTPIQVDVVPGTSLFINAGIFKQIGGFDEFFFLFFEENDLCIRIRKLGLKLYMVPKAKVIHKKGISISTRDDIEQIFNASMSYYFKKHFSLISVFLIRAVSNVNKTMIMLMLIFCWGVFLRFFKLGELMPFIGDQGWFYLSARDIFTTGSIPLVGITSSHVWLHQGPIWTYILSIVLVVFKFNPISGAYFVAFLSSVTILLLYLISKKMFSKKIAIVASLLYATSPIVVDYARFAYHTSLIPTFSLLYFFSLYKWLKNNTFFFSLALFFLAILYNLELATAIFIFILLVILFYGRIKNFKWAKETYSKKILFLGLLLGLIPMIPFLLYDVRHGFLQTIGFAGWVIYRLATFLFHPNSNLINTFIPVSKLFFAYIKNLIFAMNGIISLILLTIGVVWIFFRALDKEKDKLGYKLLFLFILATTFGIIINRTPSDAYMPMLFPFIILSVAVLLVDFAEMIFQRVPTVLLLLILVLSVGNSYVILSYDKSNKLTFTKRFSVANRIVQESRGEKYNLIGKGYGSEFKSFTMNYEYLTWWLGHPPVKEESSLKFFISEEYNDIQLIKVKK